MVAWQAILGGAVVGLVGTTIWMAIAGLWMGSLPSTPDVGAVADHARQRIALLFSVLLLLAYSGWLWNGIKYRGKPAPVRELAVKYFGLYSGTLIGMVTVFALILAFRR